MKKVNVAIIGYGHLGRWHAQKAAGTELANLIADAQGKELKYEFMDFHSSRPGHDLRYALSGDRMANMGWRPQPVRERIAEVVQWTLDNRRWLDV